MEAKELKRYIYENKCVEQILMSVNCHYIKYHSSRYWTCTNPDGDNKSAVVIYDDEKLLCVNYTRQMIRGSRQTDIIDFICFVKDFTFPEGLKYICNELGLSYYHDFAKDVPESFKFLDMIANMNQNLEPDEEIKLQPISEKILTYYKPYVNNVFYTENIDYVIQREFEVGFDMETNRYTIPIRSEIGDLVGVKGRYFHKDVPDCENKYIYIEPCPKGRILYGLYKTMPYIKKSNKIYVFEAEKAVMQAWGYGCPNSVATGGKTISRQQIDMLIRIGVEIILCFDKDVVKSEYENIAEGFPDGVDLYYMYDEQNILTEHESPADNPQKWQYLRKNNIYKLR